MYNLLQSDIVTCRAAITSRTKTANYVNKNSNNVNNNTYNNINTITTA